MSIVQPKRLSLGFSPCPNDTFIFDALVNGKIDTGDLKFDVVLDDVETLNRWAAAGKLAITKLSFSALLHLSDTYALLPAGAALGKGVGPLLVAARPLKDIAPQGLNAFLKTARIAIPGKNTTANLLLSLAFPGALDKTEVIFSDIEKKVGNGAFDAGLLIHEGRFTFRQKGLHQLLDLGAWWEADSGLPIPLGGIAMQRNLGRVVYDSLNVLIRRSLDYAWRHYPSLPSFVTENAQEMQETVMRQHIQLYVNRQSQEMDATAIAAIRALHHSAFAAGILDATMRSKSLWFD